MIERLRRKLSKIRGNYNKLMSYKGNVASTYLIDRAATLKWHEEHLIFASHISELPDNLRVLDVPFGTGRFAPFYVLKNYEVVALDISPEMLTIAKKYNQMVSSVEFIEGSALALPFDDDEFDLIVCSRFIGYIPTVEQAKKIFYEFHRVGKQHLYIGVQYLRENVAHGKEDKLGHKMNRVDLIKFIKEVGFSVLGSTLLEAKDNYQNEILMLKKI